MACVLTNANLSSEQQLNHNIALQTAQKCFGYVKGRFRRLQRDLDYCDLKFATQCIQTSIVLHNILLNFNDDCNFYIEDDKFERFL